MIDILGREEARNYFKDCGLDYNSITEGDILALVLLLNEEIKKSNNNGEVSIERFTLSKKMDVKYKKDGTLKTCFLFVNGSYFKNRECISFNEDEFIGFAGWASYNNVKPILRAFIKWCDELAKEG